MDILSSNKVSSIPLQLSTPAPPSHAVMVGRVPPVQGHGPSAVPAPEGLWDGPVLRVRYKDHFFIGECKKEICSINL